MLSFHVKKNEKDKMVDAQNYVFSREILTKILLKR